MPQPTDALTLPDGFALVRRLGEGGFGEVWQGTAPGGIPVALKFLRLDPSALATELRALEAIKSIRHAHLLTLFGVWPVGASIMLAMELADGTLLDRARKYPEGVLPRAELLEYMRQAADALDYLHLHNVQHRDVKPQNLLLVVGGILKVGDFGLAKLLEHTVTTASGRMTPAYAAPEFFNEQATVWSDQYSLAVTYCQLRGGRLPYAGTAQQIVAGHLTRPPDLSMLPESERATVGRALAKEPRERWPTCRAFVDELRQLETVVTAIPIVHRHTDETVPSNGADVPLLGEEASVLEQTLQTQPTPTQAYHRRQRWPLAIAGLVALALPVLAVSLAIWLGNEKAKTETTASTREEPVRLAWEKYGEAPPDVGTGKPDAPAEDAGRVKPTIPAGLAGLEREAWIAAILRVNGAGLYRSKSRPGKPYHVDFRRVLCLETLALLSELSPLDYLQFSDLSIDDAGLAHIKNLTKLPSLDLFQCEKITNEGLKHVAVLTSLEELRLYEIPISDAGLAHLKTLTKLRKLELNKCRKVTDEGLKHVATISSLEELDLGSNDFASNNIGDAGLAHLKTLTKLRKLNLYCCWNVTDEGLKHVAVLTAIENLNINYTKIGDAGLAHLKTLTKLRKLRLGNGYTVSDEGLKHVATLEGLEELDLSYTNFGDEGVTHLKTLTKLRKLNLSDCKQVTDEGLKHVATITSLEELDLGHFLGDNSKIGDTGLAHLKTLKKLRLLNVRGCTKVTAKGMEELQKELPDLKIER